MEEVRKCSCVSLEAKEQSNKSARCVGLFGPLSVSTVVERGEKVENVHVQLNRHISSSFDLIHVETERRHTPPKQGHSDHKEIFLGPLVAKLARRP